MDISFKKKTLLKKENAEKSRGGIPSSILVIGGLILFAIIAVSVVPKLFQKSDSSQADQDANQTQQEPTYEAVLGDIKFKLVKVRDRGNVLKISESKNPEWLQSNLTTAEKFIEVTISAENIGKENTTEGVWDVAELTDSEERIFNSYGPDADSWISAESRCGSILKPGFTPTLCVKIYEVAKISSGLKVRVLKRSATAAKEEAAFIKLGL